MPKVRQAETWGGELLTMQYAAFRLHGYSSCVAIIVAGDVRPERQHLQDWFGTDPQLPDCGVGEVLLRWKSKGRFMKWIRSRRPRQCEGWIGPVHLASLCTPSP